MIASMNKINALRIENNSAKVIDTRIDNFYNDSIVFPLINDTLEFNSVVIKDHTGWTTLESVKYVGSHNNWINISANINSHEYEIVVDVDQLIPVYNPDIMKKASQGIIRYQYILIRASELNDDTLIRIITNDYIDKFVSPIVCRDNSFNSGYELKTGSRFATINGIQISTRIPIFERSFR